VLLDIACPTTQWCEAVGSYSPNSTVTYQPLTATFSNGSWTPQRGPGVAANDTDGSFAYVSCSWPGSGAATGAVSTDNDHTYESLVDTMTGGHWTGNDVVYPAGAQLALYNEVCPPSGAAGSCLAGGFYDSATNSPGFLDTYPDPTGYQEVASDGGIFAFGTPFYGSMGGQHLDKPVVGLAFG